MIMPTASSRLLEFAQESGQYQTDGRPMGKEQRRASSRARTPPEKLIRKAFDSHRPNLEHPSSRQGEQAGKGIPPTIIRNNS